MFDKEFLKTLTIMYVEDDQNIRTSLGAILSKVFGEVIICNDGYEGIEQFKNYVLDKHIKIDLIISDINMPNMNGISMIKVVRGLDDQIPVIFTTAHGEVDYLMDAIKLKVAYYALKPIDTTELLENVSKFTMIEHNKQVIEKKTKEITQYMDIMHHISTIFKVDLEGNIIEANMMLSQLSEYTNEQLLSMKIDDVLHKDALITSYKSIVEMVEQNSLYKGKLKFASKNSMAFYLNTTVLPMYNDSTNELTGYIYIGIDQTNDELEKQQTMQRVRKNIMSQRTKENTLLQTIKDLEYKIEDIKRNSISSKDTKIIMDKLAKEKTKVTNLNNQIEHYEEKIRAFEMQTEELRYGTKEKKAEELKKKQESSKETHSLQTKVIELQSKIHKLEAQLKSSTYV